ncbi:MAG: hypothetical protein DMD77_08830 [Candidatus Rokuibacteriota bacterium]|nr:MAG: hypothetical protein DMD77_08830 [Candidatus Rokubacteria bacterium]
MPSSFPGATAIPPISRSRPCSPPAWPTAASTSSARGSTGRSSAWATRPRPSCAASTSRRSGHASRSFKGLFLSSYSTADPHVGPALEGFVSAFLEQDLSAIFPRNRLSYGYRHWFPRPSTGGACKRMHLFLRWMIRQEKPDFGLWTEVPPAALLMPVDTHIENMARSVGLTRRRSRNWKMVEEITAGLKRLDAEDPVKYDFALCHKRMSGQCLNRRAAVVCAPCALKPACVHWRGRR